MSVVTQVGKLFRSSAERQHDSSPSAKQQQQQQLALEQCQQQCPERKTAGTCRHGLIWEGDPSSEEWKDAHALREVLMQPSMTVDVESLSSRYVQGADGHFRPER